VCRVRASGTFIEIAISPGAKLGDRLDGRYATDRTHPRLKPGAFDGAPVEAEALVQDTGMTRQRYGAYLPR
jgi:hypothetical protein